VVEDGATVYGKVRAGKDTLIHGRTTVRGPVIFGEHCQIGPNAYIGPYTSIGNDVTIRNSEVENSIIMDGAHIECGKRIVDSLIGMRAKVVSSDNVPKGLKLILGDLTYIGI